jgi:hypothetical protein
MWYLYYINNIILFIIWYLVIINNLNLKINIYIKNDCKN